MADWRALIESGAPVAGVDEAGRGPLAGAVFAAAVILDPRHPLEGLDDSKKLTAPRREALAHEIRARAVAWSVAQASVEEIDQFNILQASLLAMRRAVAALASRPALVLVDGNRCPQWEHASVAIVGGDAIAPPIMAASVLAKVARDASMVRLEQEFPGYGFAVHKGYPTAAHVAALQRLGPCAAHRHSFAPVRLAAAQCRLIFE